MYCHAEFGTHRSNLDGFRTLVRSSSIFENNAAIFGEAFGLGEIVTAVAPPPHLFAHSLFHSARNWPKRRRAKVRTWKRSSSCLYSSSLKIETHSTKQIRKHSHPLSPAWVYLGKVGKRFFLKNHRIKYKITNCINLAPI